MTSIALTQPGVKLLDTTNIKKFHISEAPEPVYSRIIEAQENMLEMRYTQKADTSQNPSYSEYARVVVGGKVIAEIDNHGWTKTSNALGARLQNGLPDEAGSVISGPKLAQARAEYIAQLTGGKVVESSTALTQAQFNGIAQPTASVDYAAMRNDPLYEQLQRTKQARTEFLAQQIAQADTEEAADTDAKEDPVKAFLDYMDKSTEERYFEAMLKEMGLTKEELDALPPEEREKILKEIEEKIERQVKEEFDEKLREECAA